MQAELASAQTAVAEERRQWESQRIDADSVQSDTAEQLAARQAEFEAASRRFDQEKAAWETQCASAQHALDDRLAGLDALQVDLQSQLADLEKQRKEWEAKCDEIAAAHAAENKRLAALQDEIDFGLRALDERRAALKGRHDEAQRQIEDRTAELDRLQTELEARQQEIEESRRSMAAELAAAAPIGGNKSVEPIGPSLESEIEATTEATDRDEDPAAKASARPAKNEPVGLAPSLGRTGFNLDADESQSAARDAEGRSSDVRAARNSAGLTAPAPRTGQPALAQRRRRFH